MAVVQQLRRGTAAQHASFVGAQGEPTFETTNKRLVVHDGATLGGNASARINEVWQLLAASFGDTNAAILASMRYVRLNATLTVARTWTLPPVADVPEGQPITIVTGNSMVGSVNKLVIERNGTDTINGAATPFEITTPNTITQFYRSGPANWTVQVVGSTPDESITNAKLAPRGLAAILGRPAIGAPSGQVIDLNPSQVREIVGVYGAPRTITEAGAIAEADRGRLILASSGAWTLSLASAATLGAGFSFAILNTGAGVKTLDPAGAENIDGNATLVLQPGSYVELWCDGSNWFTTGQPIRSDSPQVLTAAQMNQVLANIGAQSAYVDVASAATTDLGAVASQNVRVTGTTTITSFGTAAAGTFRRVRFASSLTITHNATNLIVPTGHNLVVVAGDTVELTSLGSGNWTITTMPAPGLVFLRSGVVANTAQLDITLDAGFDFYELRLTQFEPVSTAALRLRVSVDNGSTYPSASGAYSWASQFVSQSSAAAYTSTGTGITTAIEITPGLQAASAGQNSTYVLGVNKAAAGNIGGIVWNGGISTTGSAVWNSGSGVYSSSGPLTNVRLLYSSGIISQGRWQILGVRK